MQPMHASNTQYDAEKRTTERVVPEPGKPVSIDLNGEDFIEVLEAMDISEGGAGFRVPYGFDGCNIDDPVTAVVWLPDPVNGNITAIGKVAHISDDVFGVSFLDMKSEHMEQLRSYINSRKS